MNHVTKQALVFLLGSIQAATHAALELLTEGKPLPWDGDEAPPEDTAEESGECRHPSDQRKSIATMGNPAAWLCKVCGHMDEGGADV